MARQFRNVTAEQIAYVAQLQRSGDEAGALQAANDIATKGFDEQTRRLKENMGTLETWADKTGKAFKSMWDAILDIGRPESSADMLASAQKAFDEADKKWQWYQSRSQRRGKTASFRANLQAHGMTGKMPVWGWQRPRCSRIWKKPVNWPPGTGPNGTHHS